MKRPKYQYLEMNFQHLVLEVRLFEYRHHIYHGDIRKPVSLLLIETFYPAGHPLPGADYDPNHIGVNRACSHSYPLLETIDNHGGLEAYVTAYLDSMTDNPQWQKLIEQAKQLALF